MGGLACGAILSREGFDICVLEQNRTIGGCLQSFYRQGRILDTGMHFVGSLSEGQIMRQYFKYFGIEKRLKLKKLDEEAFDVVSFREGGEYKLASGYERFARTLIDCFPDDGRAIDEYCGILRKIGSQISPELLRDGKLFSDSSVYMCMSAYDEIVRIIKNPLLQNVLTGNNLYHKNKSKTSLYEHCIINHSNIEGAYRFVGGSQQIADALTEAIKENGGEIIPSARVTKIHLEENRIQYVCVNDNGRFFAKSVISSIHPVHTFSLLDNNTVIKKAFFTRLKSLENSYGIFTTYLVMKPKTFKYINRNYYLYNTADVWAERVNYKNHNMASVLMSMQPVENSIYCDVVTLMMPVYGDEFRKWEQTVTGCRGDGYDEYKQELAEVMIDFASRWFPELKSCIAHVFTASPLTYRDYTSTPNGSAYGIIKDYHNPIISHLPVRTRIPNLFLTGQNLNVHGCLGVSITAALTCSNFTGLEYIARKIGDA